MKQERRNEMAASSGGADLSSAVWSKLKYEIRRAFGILDWIKDLFAGRKKLGDFFSAAPFDVTFLALVIGLLTVGVVMMFSASYVNAWNSASSNNDPYYYIKRQALFAVIGVALMIMVSFIRTDFYRDCSGFVYFVALVLLVYVLINPHIIQGKEDFKRWINLGFTTFQPSEIGKLAVIMILAYMLEKFSKSTEKNAMMIVPYAIVVCIICGLVYLENHVSGTILIFLIGAAMMFLGGVKWQWYAVAGIIGILAVTIVVMKPDIVLKGYSAERIETWKKLLTGAELTRKEATGSAWQSLQSLYAIGSGGLFGLGFGNSRQKYLYLPEPQNDFVFAVVCEELGFIKSFLIIVLFVLVVARGFVIGMRAKSKFGALLAMGISLQVGLQAALNIGVVTSTLPNTGISLPFFSYGGTSLVMLLIEMGMVLAVSRNEERKR